MEQKINQLLEKALKLFGEDADITVIVHKDGQCGAMIHGTVDNNAKAMFACMHQQNQNIGNALYRILKLNLLNIIGNISPFMTDLLESIKQVSDKLNKQLEENGEQ